MRRRRHKRRRRRRRRRGRCARERTEERFHSGVRDSPHTDPTFLYTGRRGGGGRNEMGVANKNEEARELGRRGEGWVTLFGP